jgi:PAS domain S-box-containing protein
MCDVPPVRSGVPVETLLTVLDGLPGMVGYWDRDLRNVVANRPYLDFFGIAPESMTGRHIRDVLGESVYASNLPFIRRVLAGEEQLFDRTLVDTDRRVRHTQASYRPHVVDGTVHGFFVLVTDVSDRVLAERRARRSNEQYRALAGSIPDGFVLLYDRDLRVLVAGGPELSTFGYEAAELEGHTIHEVFPADLVGELVPRYRAALTGERVEWERHLRDRIFRLKAGPVTGSDGEIFAGMVVAQDVTPHRRAQAVQAALQEIATSVARNADPDLICAQIAVSLLDIFKTDTAAVVRFAAGHRGEIVAMAPVQPESVPRRLEFGPDDPSATAHVALTGRPAVVTYRPQEEGVVGALRSNGFTAGAAAPIHHEGALWGSIALGTQQADRLTDSVLAELTRFAELVEIALGNVEAWTSLSEQATHDSLTGLHNRRGSDEYLGRELDAMRRDG